MAAASQARARGASMGPRLCGRGDAAVGAASMRSWKRFNGAAPLWARRSGVGLREIYDQVKLQWGRAFVGAEMLGRSGLQPLRRPASMGPRLCGRGDHNGTAIQSPS